MMSKYNFISICFIAFIFSYIGSTVDALVGNICTSATLNQITNASTTGVTIKVSEKEWAPGSKIPVGIDVGEENFIRNIIIWAEAVDGEQLGTHVGYWSPISEHEYVEGCGGPAISTISNQFDLNLSQINYEWNAPSETAVTPSPQPSQPIAPSPQPSQPSTPSSPQPNQPNTSPSPQPSQPSTPSSPQPDQPNTPSSPQPSQPCTSPSTSPSPTHKPKKPKHKHKHHKNHKHKHYEDFSELKEPLIDVITGKKNRLTRRDQTSVGSIIFKGVLQLMNHPDDEIYSFTSDVIAKSTSLTSTQHTTKNDTVLRVTDIDQNVPKDPPFSAAHSKFILKSHMLISILTLIVGFLTY